MTSKRSPEVIKSSAPCGSAVTTTSWCGVSTRRTVRRTMISSSTASTRARREAGASFRVRGTSFPQTPIEPRGARRVKPSIGRATLPNRRPGLQASAVLVAGACMRSIPTSIQSYTTVLARSTSAVPVRDASAPESSSVWSCNRFVCGEVADQRAPNTPPDASSSTTRAHRFDLREVDLDAKHPDDFVLDAIDLAPGPVTAVSKQVASLRNPPRIASSIGQLAEDAEERAPARWTKCKVGLSSPRRVLRLRTGRRK